MTTKQIAFTLHLQADVLRAMLAGEFPDDAEKHLSCPDQHEYLSYTTNAKTKISSVTCRTCGYSYEL